jgi:hypothetical protein
VDPVARGLVDVEMIWNEGMSAVGAFRLVPEKMLSPLESQSNEESVGVISACCDSDPGHTLCCVVGNEV